MQLRTDFLDPLFELLGWDIKNTAGKTTNEREVLLEEVLKSTVYEHSKKPDYTFRLFSERKYFVEAKKPCISIENNIECAKQTRRYGFTAKLKISVLCNFEYLLIYDCSVEVKENDIHDKALIKKYHYTEYIDKIDELKTLLGKDSVYSGLFDNNWQDIAKNLNKFSIDKLFLKQINNWRKLLGTEILKYDATISEQLLNDYVQSYINRIIFLRVCEDRNLETYQTLLQFADRNDFMALYYKFSEADRKYNSGLFDQFLSKEIIGDISSVFWIIIRQLYYPESPYSFSVFSSDILGSIYEIFLTEKLAHKDGSIKLIKKPENVDRDIITTPVYIIKAIFEKSVVPFVSGKNIDEIISCKFADIACGSGAFLLELFQLLNDTLIDYYLVNDKSQLIQIGINTYKLPFELKRRILLKCIYGIDKDFNAVEATKFGLLLKLLEGEESSTLPGKMPLLPDLCDNIYYGNSLISQKDVKGKKAKAVINPFDFENKQFDVIVGNPPYMKSEDMKRITPHEFPIYKKKYISAYKQFDKYFIFIERALELLKDNGQLGFIIPAKLFKVGAGLKLRKLLKSNGYLNAIVSFGANQVFKSTTTYTCLLFLSKETKATFRYSEIRNLNYWKLKQNSEYVYQNIEVKNLDNDVWILVPSKLQNTFDKIINQSITLQNVTEKEGIFNGIQTSANSIYIFQPQDEDDSYYYFTTKGKSWKIEKAITNPYFKTSQGINNLNTYRSLKPNARVFYPYTADAEGIKLISLKDIENNFPAAYEYLHYYKKSLDNSKRDIKPKPKTDAEWHRYGRHQSLQKCSYSDKIVVGVLSSGNKYAIDLQGTLISSGGTAGYCAITLPHDSPYSIYYIQAILNSKYLEWISSLFGEVFRGGYIARGTKVLKRLPIRKLDFELKSDNVIHNKIVKLQKRLINKQNKIDSCQIDKRMLNINQRDFDNLKEELDNILAKLYNLEDDDRLIPSIKELYATY